MKIIRNNNSKSRTKKISSDVQKLDRYFEKMKIEDYRKLILFYMKNKKG